MLWEFRGFDEEGNPNQIVKLIDNVQQYDGSGGTNAVLRTDGSLWVWGGTTYGGDGSFKGLWDFGKWHGRRQLKTDPCDGSCGPV